MTTTFPVVAPLGTVTAILDAPHEVTDAVVPLNLTVPWVVPKVVPVMVTAAPTAPVVIDRLVIAGVTVKLFPLLATFETVTTTLPVVAALGTVTPILVVVQDVTDAVVPLNLTVLFPCGEPKFVPVIVTEVPTGPEVTDRLVIVGAACAPGARKKKQRIARIGISFQLHTRIKLSPNVLVEALQSPSMLTVGNGKQTVMGWDTRL